MRKPKNRIIGNCDWCGKELMAFGTPFVVEEHEVIYKSFSVTQSILKLIVCINIGQAES